MMRAQELLFMFSVFSEFRGHIFVFGFFHDQTGRLQPEVALKSETSDRGNVL